MTRKVSLPVWNLSSARFECIWPRCGGGCCKQSRPPVGAGEARAIRAQIPRILGMLRPAARALVERGRWLTRRKKGGRRTLAVNDRYCVFYADGCVLHRLGAAEGDAHKYKPGTCITFPLDRDEHGRWYVRQWGVAGEQWDLACLDPGASAVDARASLRHEIAFAARIDAGLEAWRAGPRAALRARQAPRPDGEARRGSRARRPRRR